MKDFFISYNKADLSWAEWIAWELEAAGYTTALQAWDFRPGSNFVLEMQKATTEGERTVAVLSPDYLAAQFTQPEWAAAFGKDPTGEKGILLPVRVRPCELEGLLPQIVYIDLVGISEAEARQRLLAGANRGRAKPSVPPKFPAAIGPAVRERPRFPGMLPPIWNVPHNRNPNFTGREEQLKSLRNALTSGKAAALTALHGMGGVGKTQVAIEYAYRHAADYELIWWVRSEEAATLASEYAGLAEKLKLPECGAVEQPTIVQAVRQALEQKAGWLLVFDNATEAREVQPYLPQNPRGHVLITSRNPVWRGTAVPLSVQQMPVEEAVEFLLKRTNQADREAARKLADTLGCLPLALEQAGAYMEETGMTLAGYEKLCQPRLKELLELGKPATDYPATVATTWEISIQEAQKKSPAAAELLNVCAFLAPDDIPIELFVQGKEHLPELLREVAEDALKLDAAVAAVRRFSLIERAGNALTVHRLVQGVARDRLDDAIKKTFAGAAIRLVNKAFPFDSGDVRTWPQCARLLPHALAAAAHAELLRAALEQVGRLLNQAGIYLRGRAELKAAKVVHERALKIAEAVYGSEHPEVATGVNNLGLVLKEQGDLAGARKCYERALRIQEEAFGPEHPTVAIPVNNLGAVLREQGDLAGARKCFERALRIQEEAFGPEHPTVAIPVNNLGLVLEEQGDLAGARKCFERALRIQEEAFGPEHPTVAIDVNNLGLVLKEQGDLAGARECFERALKIDEAAYGSEHPTVAIDVNNLGLVLGEQGDLGGARKCYERALAILLKAYGEDHPKTRLVRRNLELLSGKKS